MTAPELLAPPRLDFAASDTLAGFRLRRLEVYNWGTFHQRVWRVDGNGTNTLLTGDVGSGKSTLVDAISTLLVPPQKLAYNRAAGADARERTARSYVLGHWKSERGEGGTSARPVTLRGPNDYSVVLAQFENQGYSEIVTLAQVFWMSSPEGQPDRLYLVADRALTIGEHFSGSPGIAELRKRLRAHTKELGDSFTGYSAAFRRRFGLANDQALELFHQTVSMKTVGNLTDFVRQHMLEAFPVDDRIRALVDHFDDLVRAHDAVLRAKAQIERLQPLVIDCDRCDALREEIQFLTRCREALHGFVSRARLSLLAQRADRLEEELGRLDARLAELAERKLGLEDRSERLKAEIAANGGDRLEQIRREVTRLEQERDDRRRRASQYDALARSEELAEALDAERFLLNTRALGPAQESTRAELAQVESALTDAQVHFRTLREQHQLLRAELDSLRRRRSNIPARKVALRAQLCLALELEESALPFAGELIQVRPEEQAWEGAAERILHNFGTSLLVSQEQYGRVADWVDRTHLGDRLVYYRVHGAQAARASEPGPRSLPRKLSVKPDSDHYAWLAEELARRFDYVCCDDLAQFRRERQAVTRAGQVKGAGERHEKDDRTSIADRSRYVLGWTNETKIAALEAEARSLEARLGDAGEAISRAAERKAKLEERLDRLSKLLLFVDFRDLDWRSTSSRISELEDELRALEAASDRLRGLRESLSQVLAELRDLDAKVSSSREERGKQGDRLETCRAGVQECQEALAAVGAEDQERLFPALEAMEAEAWQGRALTPESADARERELREHLQARVDAATRKVARLREGIVQAMQAYLTAYPAAAGEADASVEAADEYRRMLQTLVSDDLPRFERQFKELLNENAIREIAGFHAQLQREKQLIRERIEEINGSLRTIDYNPNRYIVLEAAPTPDPEIREFQGDLRACIEGSLTGSEDQAYSEAKFAQVKRIIDRFRGREGMAELDRRWTRKVTDVRSWSVFSASERWKEDDSEYEHYTDSGGKSGGQKEKLAYTVLAASLAYQFGLKAGERRSRSFRFVVIDEAFARGSDDSAAFALELFHRMNLQLLVVTPLQKIHVIEPYVANVAFVHNQDGRLSMVRNLTIEEYRAERAARAAGSASSG
jgi:uncharacterized protein YPO0396